MKENNSKNQILTQIKKDILHLYDVQSRYGGVMGDLCFDEEYDLPYWDYLTPDIKDEDFKIFITNGCMVMILTMAWEYLDSAGGYIFQYKDTIKEALENSKESLVNQKILHYTTTLAVDSVIADIEPSRKLIRLSDWVHRNIIMNYYYLKVNKKFCDNFDGNSYDLIKLQMKKIIS